MEENKMEIQFKGKIRKSNTVHVITVPSQYMKNGYLWDGEEMTIKIDNGE